VNLGKLKTNRLKGQKKDIAGKGQEYAPDYANGGAPGVGVLPDHRRKVGGSSTVQKMRCAQKRFLFAAQREVNGERAKKRKKRRQAGGTMVTSGPLLRRQKKNIAETTLLNEDCGIHG